MKKRLLICLSLIFMTCLFCLPLAFTTQAAHAITNFDISGYTVRSAHVDTQTSLYSNGRGEFIINNPVQNPTSPKMRKLTAAEITGQPNKEFRKLTEFDNREFMLPTKNETEFVVAQVIDDLGIPKLKIDAKKAGKVIIYVAIGDRGASAEKPEIYVINFEVICDLPSTVQGSVPFYNTSTEDTFKLTVGEQRQISLDDIIKKINTDTQCDFIDSTNIYFYSVTPYDGTAQDGVKIKSFYMGKLFTIYGEKENPSSSPYIININIRDTSPESQSVTFQMQVKVTAPPKSPTIKIENTSIEIKSTRIISTDFLAKSPDGRALFFNANTNGNGERHALRDNDRNTIVYEYDPDYGTESWAVINSVCEARIKTDPTDRNKNQLEIIPIKNGFVRLVVWVANSASESNETQILLSITVREIYDIQNIHMNSLMKTTLSIHDDVFGTLEEDGFSMTGIDSGTANSGKLVASVQSGSLTLNPKGAGDVELKLVFSDGASRIVLPVTVVIHQFNIFQDLSPIEIILIFAGLALLILIIVLIIVFAVKKRKKKAVDKVESAVVIGRRDLLTGQVVNPALQKVQLQQQGKVAYAANVNVGYPAPNPYAMQFQTMVQPQQPPVMALNAYAGQPPVQPVFQQAQPQPATTFMALPPTSARPEAQAPQYAVAPQQQPQVQQQPQPQIINIYSNEQPKEEEPVIIAEQPRQTIIMQQPVPPQQTIIIPAEPVAEKKDAKLAEEARAEHKVAATAEPVTVTPKSTRQPTDDEILEKAFKERYQNTMKYRQFRKDKELQDKILAEEREKLRHQREADEAYFDAPVITSPAAAAAEKSAKASAPTKSEQVSEKVVEVSDDVMVNTEWLEEASLGELIDKKMDLEEDLLKTNSALKEIAEEKTKLETFATETMKKYKDLEKEIDELKIKLNETKNPDDATPIYDRLNAAEGEYAAMKESMPSFVAKMKEKQTDLADAEDDFKTRKANLELSKMDIDDRIQEVKHQQAASGVVTLSYDTIEAMKAEAKAEAVAEVAKKGTEEVSDEDFERLVQSLLAANRERGENELKREEAKHKKEFAQEELKELNEKLARAGNDAERQMLKSDIEQKKSEVAETEKLFGKYDDLIAEQAVILAAQEAKLASVNVKAGTQETKMKDFASAKAKQEAQQKEERERILADRQTAEDKIQKAEEMEALTELMLKTVTDRNRTELKSDNIKFRKDLAEKDIQELEIRLAGSTAPAEQTAIRAQISEKKDDITDYNKKLGEYSGYMSEYDERMKDLEKKLGAITAKYGMEKQMQEFNLARVQQDFDHKVDKERIRSERVIEVERLEAEKKLERERIAGEARLSNIVDERTAAAERALAAERAENERRFRELEQKSKAGSLEERLAYKRQQLAFVSEDIPRMRDPEQGVAMLQKVEKIEKDLAQDERNSDIIFEIGRVKDSINHSTELVRLRQEIAKKETVSAPAPAPVAAAPATRTVVRKVTNNVRRVSSASGTRQPQIIRVQGSRPVQGGARPAAQGQRPAQSGQRPMARPAAQGQRPTQSGQRPMARPAGQTARPMASGQRPMARPAAQGQRPTQSGQRPMARPGVRR